MPGPESFAEIEIDGRRLAWRTLGRGPKVLLINGYGATSGDWDPAFLAGMARSFELICPDNRGVGASELGAEQVTIDAMAADLEALLDALDVEGAPVIGWSMGGFIAQRLVARCPQRVTALGLLSTSPGGSHSVLADPEIWFRLIDHSGTPRAQASRLISLLFPPDLAPDIDRHFGEVVAAARAALSPEVFAAQEAAMIAWHSAEQNRPESSLSPRTLIAHGDTDVIIPASNATPLSAAWAASQLELFEGCGHAFFAQEPQRASRLISAFLDT